MPARKVGSPARVAKKKAAAGTDAATRGGTKPRSVILQARVDGSFAQELVERDAVVLGLDGASEVVREGLRLVHRRAQEQALIDSYDDFYGGQRAPLPAGVAPPESV